MSDLWLFVMIIMLVVVTSYRTGRGVSCHRCHPSIHKFPKILLGRCQHFASVNQGCRIGGPLRRDTLHCNWISSSGEGLEEGGDSYQAFPSYRLSWTHRASLLTSNSSTPEQISVMTELKKYCNICTHPKTYICHQHCLGLFDCTTVLLFMQCNVNFYLANIDFLQFLSQSTVHWHTV